MNAPRVIRGVVRDAAGAAVAQASVFFVRGPGRLPDVAALTDGQGRFALTAPRAGDYVIGSYADASGAAQVAVAVGIDDVVIEITLTR